MKLFQTKKEWLQYSLYGALTYPIISLIIYILAFITTPFGLRNLFEQLLGILIYPASVTSIQILYMTSSQNWFFFIILILFFLSFIGAIAGLLIYSIKVMLK